MTMRLRHVQLLLGLLAAAVPALLACPASAEEGNSLRGGSSAIQFLTFGGGSRSPLRTSGLYLKHHLSDGSALRIGVDFSLDEASGKAPPGNSSTDVLNYRNYSISVTGEFVRYLDSKGPVTVFVGFGPYWARGRSLREEFRTLQVDPTLLVTSNYKNETRSWEIGGTASAGFEWFFRPKLSLLGRVGANVGFGEQHQISQSRYSVGSGIQDDTRRFDVTTAVAGTSSAALGLSAYF